MFRVSEQFYSVAVTSNLQLTVSRFSAPSFCPALNIIPLSLKKDRHESNMNVTCNRKYSLLGFHPQSCVIS
jgi:hypothetical protein